MSDKFKKLWAVAATTLVAGASIISGSPLPVVVATICGIIYVVGVSFGWKHSNAFGAALAGIFGFLSYEAGFFGNALINLGFSLPMSIYGWYLWCQHSGDGGVEKRSLSSQGMVVVTGMLLVGLAISSMFSFHTGAKLPVLDALTTVMPIIGTMLLIKAYKEQWLIWIPYNAIEVFMWFTASSVNPDVLAILVMRIVFLVNSLIGYREWSKA